MTKHWDESTANWWRQNSHKLRIGKNMTVLKKKDGSTVILRTVDMQCSDCGDKQSLGKYRLRRSGRVRCVRCGGPMNLPHQA